MIETISLAADLSDTLVRYVLDKTAGDPVQVARAHLILPTRRACLTVKQAFFNLHQSSLLPHLIPVYELDDLSVDIPPAMPEIERTLLLAKLCQKKPNITTPDQAVKVAISLGHLLDEFYQFETDTSKIHDLVQDSRFAEHWNETVQFLDILTEVWPTILASHHQIDSVQRRIKSIDAYTNGIKHNTTDLIIAAGLDAGLPALRRLLSVIDKLPNGIILTQGADTDLTSDQLLKLPANHYQQTTRQILEATGHKISDIHHLGPQPSESEHLIQEVLKPEYRTEEWRHSGVSPDSVRHLTRIDCDTSSDEALTIAFLLRQVLETPGQTAALVTPDRNLARRVILEMKRWGVTLDDSAGTPLSQTDIGVYLNLITKLGSSHGQSSDLLALLKHPLSADGQNPMSFRHVVKSAEKLARQEQKPFTPPLRTPVADFIALFQNNILTPFKTILQSHIQVAEALATSHDRTGAERLWSDEAGQTAFSFLTELMTYADSIGDIEPCYYPNLLDLLMNSLTVRLLYGMHPRLDILGPIESRFHHYDVCLLSGLNEGTFPTLPDTGPWLNRAMRQTLGLPDPDIKLAGTAMDFAHCFCGTQVILTRAKKSDGAETIPSRFLSRLEAVSEATHIPLPVQSDIGSSLLDTPTEPDIIDRPCPRPPVSARPTALSVTKIELWMRNPYAIYARYILKLYPLDPLESQTKQNIYGSAIHHVLDDFITQNPNNQNKADLMTLADKYLTEYGFNDSDKAFYLPRFSQTADYIISYQQSHPVASSYTERTGSMTFDVNGHSFTLTGTADRIDLFPDGTAGILDYKTGAVPSQKEVMAGFAPQLPLEALLYTRGGFPDISVNPLSALSYIKLSAKESDCKETNLLSAGDDTDLIEDNFNHLKTLIDVFNHPETPYEACPVAGKEPTYNDYEHLSRSAEWINGEES